MFIYLLATFNFETTLKAKVKAYGQQGGQGWNLIWEFSLSGNILVISFYLSNLWWYIYIHDWIFLVLFWFLQSVYRKTLQIAKLLADKALEAQACYSLGNTYTLLRDYEKAIEYHMRHLQIAQELNDRVGEGRACWSLGNAHTALGNHEDAMQFANQHLQISKEVYLFYKR